MDQDALPSINLKGNTPVFMGKEYAGLSKTVFITSVVF